MAWTHLSPPWAFFSLPTRAWELAVGGWWRFRLRSGGACRRCRRSSRGGVGWG
ncbi:putative acyltransferase domain protein [Mycobacterium xenopi 3993]|nr:putative acyltransferase domain protein [Mycobacterium xenopi 3993]